MIGKKYNEIFLKSVIGDIDLKKLRYIEYYTSENISIVTPGLKFTFNTDKKEVSHPGYLFVVYIDNRNNLNCNEKYFCKILSPGISYPINNDVCCNRDIAIFISKTYFEKIYQTYSVDIKQYNRQPFYINKDIVLAINRFIDEYEDVNVNSHKVFKCLSFIITNEIIKCLIECTEKEDTLDKIDMSDYDITTQVIEYIDHNYFKKINIPILCKKFKISKSTLYKKFEKRLGKTPIDYLNQIRMQKAKKFLRRGQKSVIEIATMCGFSSSSYFTAYFSKLNDMTPKEYANKYK